MSKAETLRHGPRFAKQLDGLHRMDALAAAREAVVKAAMAWFNYNGIGDTPAVLSTACAALAKLERKP